MTERIYIQCVLRNVDKSQTSWIPKQFAKIGKVLKLKSANGWQNGWRVQYVGSEKTERQIAATGEGRMYFATRQSTESELKR